MSDASSTGRAGWWAVAAAAALAPFFATRVWCNDVWWHLATGRWIVAHREIPRADPFSYTLPGAPWDYVPWLADLALYGAHAVGGPAGLVLWKGVVAFALLALLGVAVARLTRGDRVAVLACLLLTAILVQPRLSMARPLAMGAAFLAGAVALSAQVWISGRVRHAAWLLLLIAAWAPVHGSSILGPPIAAALAVAWTGAGRGRRGALFLGGIFLCSLALLALLPSGRGVLASALAHGRSTCMVTFIQEWRAAQWTEPRVWMSLLCTGIAAALAAPRWREQLLPLSLAAGGATLVALAARNAYVAILLQVPLWGVALGLAGLRLRAWLRPSVRWALGVGSLLLFILILGTSGRVFLDWNFGLGTAPDRYPLETLDTLRRLPERRVVNDFSLGGYLIWEELPGGVFMDGRTLVLYGDDFCRDVLGPLYADPGGPGRTARRFDADYVLAEWGSALYGLVTRSEEWIPLHHGIHSSLFVRADRAADVGGIPGILLQPELRQLEDPPWMGAWFEAVLSDPARREALYAALEWTLARSPYSPVLARTLSFLRSSHPARAAELEPRLRAILEPGPPM